MSQIEHRCDIPEHRCDILVAGSGPVGMALAHALARLGKGGTMKVMLTGDALAGDDRPIALSWGSRLILQRLGCWDALPVTPIKNIHVSQQRGFGRTLISAADHAIDALGYVTSYRDLLAALSGLPSTLARLGGRVSNWTVEEDGIRVECGTDTVHAQLLVLADGGAPHTGADAGKETVKAYDQSAIVCELKTEKPHAGIAWERFGTEGPLALLPFRDRHAMVWTSRTASAERLLALDEPAFLAEAQLAFGHRLGRFLSAGPRAAFALTLKHRHRAMQARVIPIGNAAQTLHPVAGQGLNLGLRDAWELAELAADADWPGVAGTSAPAPGSTAFAHRYASRRQVDRRTLVHLTDGLISAFGVDLPFASTLRGAALAFLDVVPPARRFLSRRMMFGVRALP